MTRDLSSSDWFQTIKGNAYFLFDPRPEDFDIEEIAHGLAMQCRFNGHTKYFYSVAQHSVLVSRLLQEWGEPLEVVFTGLMHDAVESYLGDLIRPIKRRCPEYVTFETLGEIAMTDRFGITFPFPPVIKKADTTMLLVERRDLLAPPPRPWNEPEGITLPVWELGPTEVVWQEAKEVFLARFKELWQLMGGAA